MQCYSSETAFSLPNSLLIHLCKSGQSKAGLRILGKVDNLLRLTIILVFLSMLAACAPGERAPANPMAEIGTRALIKRGGQDFESEITDVRGKLVTMEIRWQDSLVLSRDYYRGLYPVAGVEGKKRFELDFDQSALEALFPLKVGKSVWFEGNLKLIEKGEDLNVDIGLSVEKKTTLNLSSGIEEVFVVDTVTRILDGEDAGNIYKSTSYFSPKLGMILKYVSYERGRQNFWRVVEIEKTAPGSRPKRRRAGTVAV